MPFPSTVILGTALSDFFSQPFGAFGAVCIMLAVTAINSQWLAARLDDQNTIGPFVFNSLNLIGGSCLLANALIRSEIVWVVLEIYFVLIALKGLWQLRAKRQDAPVVDLRMQAKTNTDSSSTDSSSPDVTYVLHMTLKEYRDWSAAAQEQGQQVVNGRPPAEVGQI